MHIQGLNFFWRGWDISWASPTVFRKQGIDLKSSRRRSGTHIYSARVAQIDFLPLRSHGRPIIWGIQDNVAFYANESWASGRYLIPTTAIFVVICAADSCCHILQGEKGPCTQCMCIDGQRGLLRLAGHCNGFTIYVYRAVHHQHLHGGHSPGTQHPLPPWSRLCLRWCPMWWGRSEDILHWIRWRLSLLSFMCVCSLHFHPHILVFNNLQKNAFEETFMQKRWSGWLLSLQILIVLTQR